MRPCPGRSPARRAWQNVCAADVSQVPGGNQTLESIRAEGDSVNSQLHSDGFQVCGPG